MHDGCVYDEVVTWKNRTRVTVKCIWNRRSKSKDQIREQNDSRIDVFRQGYYMPGMSDRRGRQVVRETDQTIRWVRERCVTEIGERSYDAIE